MDINCGTITDGSETVDEVGPNIFQEILDVAFGNKTLPEELGAGDAEIPPWQTYTQRLQNRGMLKWPYLSKNFCDTHERPICGSCITAGERQFCPHIRR